MNYSVRYERAAVKTLDKMDASARNRILKWIGENINGCDNPRTFGKALSENLAGLWRYRIGNYRILCDIQDDVCVILVIQIGHRSTIYRA
jgi:mRNA interferase RelE/StbE